MTGALAVVACLVACIAVPVWVWAAGIHAPTEYVPPVDGWARLAAQLAQDEPAAPCAADVAPDDLDATQAIVGRRASRPGTAEAVADQRRHFGLDR